MNAAFFQPVPALQGKPGAIAGVCIAAAAVAIGGGFGIPAATKSNNMRDASALTPSAPPSATFAIVWSVLYVLGGVALALQGMNAVGSGSGSNSNTQTGIKWASFGLLAAAVLASWTWPVVYNQHTPGAPDATWFLAGIMALVLCGVLLQNKQLTNILWAPWLAWLVFALMLSVQSNTGFARSPLGL